MVFGTCLHNIWLFPKKKKLWFYRTVKSKTIIFVSSQTIYRWPCTYRAQRRIMVCIDCQERKQSANLSLLFISKWSTVNKLLYITANNANNITHRHFFLSLSPPVAVLLSVSSRLCRSFSHFLVFRHSFLTEYNHYYVVVAKQIAVFGRKTFQRAEKESEKSATARKTATNRLKGRERCTKCESKQQTEALEAIRLPRIY